MMKKIFFLLLLLFHSSSAGAEIIDSIVATAGDRIITYQEVLTESKLAAILSSKEPVTTLPIEGSFTTELLDQMINIELIFHEAKRMDFKLQNMDILSDIIALEKLFYYQGDFAIFLEQEGLTMDDIVEKLSMRKIAEAFVAEKLALMSHVSAKEVEEYFNEKKDQFRNSELKDVEPRIRKMLEDKKGADYLDKWIEKIREKGNVTYLKFPPD